MQQHQNRYPGVRLAEIQFPLLSPRCGKEKFYSRHSSRYPVGIFQLPRFAARSVTVDLWRTRGVQTTYTAAKVIPDKSLGSKRFPGGGMSARGKSPRFMVAIRRIVSRQSSNITTLGASRGNKVARVTPSWSCKLIKTWNREADYARRKKTLETSRGEHATFERTADLVLHFPRNSGDNRISQS